MDAWYYFNFSSGATSWEHPLDTVYRERVEQARREGDKGAAEVHLSETEVPTDFSEKLGGADHVEGTTDFSEKPSEAVEVNKELESDSDKSRTLNEDPLADDRDSENETGAKSDKSEKDEVNTKLETELSSHLEAMELRPKLAPLGSLGPLGQKKALPPLQKLAPVGALDRPKLGSIEKPRSLDRAPLGALASPTRGGSRQSSLESLGWKGEGTGAGTRAGRPGVGTGGGRAGSPGSSLLSGSSLGSRGSFLKPERDEEEEEEEDEEEEEEESTSRVKGILRGSPAKERDDKEGSR